VSDVAKSAAGWVWPLNSRKAHYFTEGEHISICRRMMVFHNNREQGNDESVDNCATCKKKKAKQK
jgi:hypothetical protein